MRRYFLTLILPVLFFLSAVSCAPKPPGTEVTGSGIRFSFYAPTAKTVAVAGSFNAWDIRKDTLSGPDKNGVWMAEISVPPGRYEYLFIVNGNDWQPDPSAPTISDGFGGKNSILLVP